MKSVSLCYVAIALIWVLGCPASMKGEETGAAAVKTTTAGDGVKIAYDVRGKGDTALVFVHGWCSNRAAWKRQVEAFADDYRVVAIDLPGHGVSGRDREAWSFASFAEDVQKVVQAEELKKVVLVGHSMGGPIALDVAARMKGRVIGVIPVDTLQNAEIRVSEAMLEQIAVAIESDFKGSMNALLPNFFLPTASPELVEQVIDDSLKADQKMAAAIMRDRKTVDEAALLSNAGVPVRCINAAAGEPGPPTTKIEINRKYGDFDAVFVEGVGHFPHMERSEEFNRQLRTVLAEFGEE